MPKKTEKEITYSLCAYLGLECHPHVSLMPTHMHMHSSSLFFFFDAEEICDNLSLLSSEHKIRLATFDVDLTSCLFVVVSMGKHSFPIVHSVCVCVCVGEISTDQSRYPVSFLPYAPRCRHVKHYYTSAFIIHLCLCTMGQLSLVLHSPISIALLIVDVLSQIHKRILASSEQTYRAITSSTTLIMKWA